MSFEEMHRRQQAIARRRGGNKKKFSLLLSPVKLPSSNQIYVDRNRSRMKYVVLTVVPVLFVLWLYLGKGRAGSSQKSLLSQTDGASSVRNKYWKANVIQENYDNEESIETGDYDGEKYHQAAKMANSSRPFSYIGDINPSKPLPWPASETDWWSLHSQLVQDVKASDALPPQPFDIESESRTPQLIFYGDSITEGWLGTSFGRVPGKHRMWDANEHRQVRRQFENLFGEHSAWGKRALKPPLVLGISGSRTYDFLWRLEDGEFAKSPLMENEGVGEKKDDSEKNVFQLEKLERIYIVLMGTNNLGGGMLPGPTVEGMDAVGRAILELHEKNFPNTPSAMLFSELLPRKDDFRAIKMCPPRCADNATLTPYESFMPAIGKVNAALPEVLNGWRNDYGNSRIVLLSSASGDAEAADEGSEEYDYAKTINCGRSMFAFEFEAEFDMYMPDRLHPNAKGYELWSRCLKRGLESVMDHTISL